MIPALYPVQTVGSPTRRPIPPGRHRAGPALGTLTVRFLAAGHGDSILLRTSAGHNILIDSGIGRWKRGDHLIKRRILPLFKRLGIRTLHAFIITHPHNDHYGDPAFLRQHVTFRNIYTNADGRYMFTRLMPELIGTPAGPIPLKVLKRGDRLRFGRLQLNVLHPRADGKEPRKVETDSEVNNRSLVIRATHGRIRFLFTGDLSGSGEWRMVRTRGLPGRAHVLKLGHHGYNTASDRWIRAVRPRYAVRTCCNAPWYNVHNASLERRLKRYNARLLRTDKHKDIIFKTNGRTLSVRTETGFNRLSARHRFWVRCFDRAGRSLRNPGCDRLPRWYRKKIRTYRKARIRDILKARMRECRRRRTYQQQDPAYRRTCRRLFRNYSHLLRKPRRRRIRRRPGRTSNRTRNRLRRSPWGRLIRKQRRAAQ